MTSSTTPGSRLVAALEAERPLQIVGTVNAFSALQAERAGFRAIYLSGAGVSNVSFGFPDLGMIGMNDVVEDIRRITGVCSLPMLVDADTGYGSALVLGRAVREFQRAGAAAMQIEDQVQAKRCGHRPGKALVSSDEMCDRIKAAVDARSDEFRIMARTDAYGVEGLEAGADMIFAEAMHEIDEFRRFTSSLSAPVLANITEFGKTPLFGLEELRAAGVAMALYPLTAFRAMARAGEEVYEAIRGHGTQQPVLDRMQTRDELYERLRYHDYERRLDELFARERGD